MGLFLLIFGILVLVLSTLGASVSCFLVDWRRVQ